MQQLFCSCPLLAGGRHLYYYAVSYLKASVLPIHPAAHIPPSDDAAMTDTPTSVLIVEDNAETQLLLEHILHTRYHTTIVSSVDEALQACLNHVFDLLILDINLGEERTGTDLLHTLRATPYEVSAPAMALTAYAMPGDQQRFEDEGFASYVSKPFVQKDLTEAIDRCLKAST